MPASAAARATLTQRWHAAVIRDLLRNLVLADLTARYKTATFGLLWFLLNPALMTAVVVVVIQGVIQYSMPRYHVFLLAALLPWTFFQMGLTHATSSLTRAPGMVKRVLIPRVLLPIAAILASLVHFLISLVLLLVVLAVMGAVPGPTALAALPIVVSIQVVSVIGLGLLTSSLNVLYRDVEHFVVVAVRAGFWLTPIFYPLDSVSARWRPLALLNPMTAIIESYRDVLVRHVSPSPGLLATAAGAAVLLLVLGALSFARIEPQMDDYV